MCLCCWLIYFQENKYSLPWRWSHPFKRKLPGNTISNHISLPIYARTGFSCDNLWTWKVKCNRCGSHIGPGWSADSRFSTKQHFSLLHIMASSHHALSCLIAVNSIGHLRLEHLQQPQSSAVCRLQLYHLNSISVDHMTSSLCGMVLSVERPLPWIL